MFVGMITIVKEDSWYYLASNGVCLGGIGYLTYCAAYNSEEYKFFKGLMG
jgi:hypothetical protein